MALLEISKDNLWIVPSWNELGIVHGFTGSGQEMRGDGISQDLEISFKQIRLRVALLKQIHGADVLQFNPELLKLPRSAADGWVNIPRKEDRARLVDAHQVALGILTADCVPVLLLCRKTGATGALHCGWRSAVQDILPVLLRKLTAEGVAASDLELAFGPGIGPCCFEVEQDVVVAVNDALSRLTNLSAHTAPEVCSLREQSNSVAAVDRSSHKEKKYSCNLKSLLVQQALSFGIEQDSIHQITGCTYCDTKFFSFRRQGQSSGRQLSFIATA
jgi:YfiH family protein